MDNPQFRSVPDGQFTQTIYTLLREQKYTEVRKHLNSVDGARKEAPPHCPSPQIDDSVLNHICFR